MMEKKFNKGHVAEYIFATMMAASFRTSSTRKDDLQEQYYRLKLQLEKMFLENENRKDITVSQKNVHLIISLGKNAPAEMSRASLSYYFNLEKIPDDNNAKQLRNLEESAMKYVANYKASSPDVWRTKEKIEINSVGVVDPLATKADITLKVGNKEKTFSLKTKSETVHGTTMSARGLVSMFNILFGAKYKESDFLEYQLFTIPGVQSAYKKVLKDVTSNNVIKNKPQFITGLKNIITKGGPDFQLVKLSQQGYSTLVFKKEYEKIALLFDYSLRIKDEYLYVDMQVFTDMKTIPKFLAVRRQEKNILLEAGTMINLLANKNLSSFLNQFKAVKKDKGMIRGMDVTKGISPEYYQLVQTFQRSAKFISNKQTINGKAYLVLTSEGEAFEYMVKQALGIKYL